MPLIIQISHEDTKNIIVEILKNNNDKDFVIRLLDRRSADHWNPVTLIGGGLFHISFGAILTGVAVTHGQERREAVKNGNHS